jgi:hypothetical protein
MNMNKINMFLSGFLWMMLLPGNLASAIDLKSDTLLTLFYNAEEIRSLGIIIEYVDSLVKEHTYVNNTEKAYHQYFEKQSKYIKKNSMFFVPVSDDEKHEFLESIDSNVFHSIWGFHKYDKPTDRLSYKDTVLISFDKLKWLHLKSNGRFMDYIEKIGERDTIYNQIHESIFLAGGVPAGLARVYPMNHKIFDFNIVKNRLFAAVYILTLEENVETRLDKFFKDQGRTSRKLFISKKNEKTKHNSANFHYWDFDIL